MSKKIKLHQIKIVVPHSSIRLQLITGFLVPIIFIIIIGVVSYQKSYEGLTQNYEKSALTAIDMTADGRMISVNNPVDSGLIDTAESSSYVSGWQTLLLYECREFRDRWKNCCDGAD